MPFPLSPTRQDCLKLQQDFVAFVAQGDAALAQRYERGDETTLGDLVPHLEDFLGNLFGITADIHHLQHQHQVLAPLFTCRRNFIQRRALKKYAPQALESWDADGARARLCALLNAPYLDELSLAMAIQEWLGDESRHGVILELAERYAAWACLTEAGKAFHRDTVLFQGPKKIDYGYLVTSPKKPRGRVGFSLTDPGLTRPQAQGEALYCIHCHHQGKDSCSKGLHHRITGQVEVNPLGNRLEGCPLGQKISQMAEAKSQGYTVGALAIAMVDNPMIPATGHRICNACRKACIYQRQEPVDVPGLETHILQDTLGLPYGVEIYHLLTRWNPLNLNRPVPRAETGYAVLVAGLGPAGFTLAYHLLQEGHRIWGVDAMKLEPLPDALVHAPIRQWSDLNQDLSTRNVGGLGGVMEYGITSRWNKNYLKLIHLVLARHPRCRLSGGVLWGGTISHAQARALGMDHVALCLGAGKPQIPLLKNILAQGVRTASDFLMALQLTDVTRQGSLANLQVRLPVVVMGGGLTAFDAATEALAYYPLQVENFLVAYEKHGGPDWTPAEQDIAAEFLDHARQLRDHPERRLALLQSWGGVTVAYRKGLQESPAYRLNHEEVQKALDEGIFLREHLVPQAVQRDENGSCTGLLVRGETGGEEILPARSILVAVGTQAPVDLPTAADISVFGDLDPTYRGSVVHAMASAKAGYGPLGDKLRRQPPRGVHWDAVGFTPHVKGVRRLTPTIVELIVHAPWAAQNFQPGQFFRLQNYGGQGPLMESLALTGAQVDRDLGLVTLVVLEMGASSGQVAHLRPGDPVILMGPTGAPTEIPQGERVLLVGGGLGNAVLIPVAEAMKSQGCEVTYVAGYGWPGDRYYADRLVQACDRMIWCSMESPGFTPTRLQDSALVGTVVDALNQMDLGPQDRLLTVGSAPMMAAVQAVGRERLAHIPIQIASVNAPMQCMTKGLCGQCIQSHGEGAAETIVFSCACQDQNLQTVHLDVLQARLGQNAVMEKVNR